MREFEDATIALNVRWKLSGFSAYQRRDGAFAVEDSAGVGGFAIGAATKAEEGESRRARKDGGMRKQLVSVLFGGFLVALLSACVSFAETPGEHFRKVMKEMEDLCVSKKLIATDSRCILPKLKPADPLATEEGRFAHSIKIPNPVPVDSGYKPGMTPEQYFEHLCKTEAGEFVFKTVENVEGLYLLRPNKSDGYTTEHLYALEAPYGRGVGGTHPEEYFVQPVIGKYEFLEVPLTSSGGGTERPIKYSRYYRDENSHPDQKYQAAINGQFITVPYIVAETETSAMKSRYGFTWRGIVRPHDRENGIGGGEIIVLDLQTREVLAVRRGFVLGVSDPSRRPGFSWSMGKRCVGSKDKSDYTFLNEVLKPAVRR
jgi:hypothetical protein